MEGRPIHKLDLRGDMIPFALLKVSQAFRNIDPGDSLEVLWRDPEMREDLLRVLPESSYDLVGEKTIKDERPFEEPSYRIEIRKKTSC